MQVLAIDVETYSDLDISKVGAYKYCQSPKFEILLFAYAVDDGPVQIIDVAQGEKIPSNIAFGIRDPEYKKTAFNANFERNALMNGFKFCDTVESEQWECTMIKALTLGLPGSLAMIGEALNLDEDKQKMKEGKALIQYFCKPCKPTKANNKRTRNLPQHDPEKWELFKEYCKQDVEVERTIRNQLEKYSTTETEKRLWELDQKINDRGVNTDLELIDKAIKGDADHTEKLLAEAKELTGLANPNSTAQLKKWLSDRLGKEITSLSKDLIPDLIGGTEDQDTIRVLELRQLMSKTSIKKYEAMKVSRGYLGRVRGLLQFYGASRTGRWAGRLVQVQNLPQNHLPDLDTARELVKEGRFEDIEFLYDSLPDTLSQLIRTAFIPSEGNRFIVADFSAIEARVIAWFANEQWRQEVFKENGDIYCASASQMFKIPVVKNGINGHMRQKGKIAELALGYGGSVGALTAMGALNMGLEEDELKPLVDSWRSSNTNITKFWWDCDKAAKKAVEDKTTVCMQYGLKFIYSPGVLFIQLPSGRKLAYLRPQVEPGKFGNDVITYEGMAQATRQWVRLDTYGPKIVENIVQATARDCLAEAMFKVEDRGYPIVFHVHDEIIMDVPKDYGSLEEVNSIFGEPIAWAPGLLLSADGYECNYYQKD